VSTAFSLEDQHLQEDLAKFEQIKAQATWTQAQTVAAEPEAPKAVTEVAAEPGASTSSDQWLTETEAITIIQGWVTQDADFELPERRTIEEMVNDLRDAAEYRGSTVPASRFEEIVKTYAPDAPQVQPQVKLSPGVIYNPTMLAPLIESGVAYNEYDHWFLKRCRGCGNFRTECCGQIEDVDVLRHDNKTLTAYGRQALLLDPIKPPAPPKVVERIETWTKQSWWHHFRGTGELEGNGTLKMYIENVIPEGICLITAVQISRKLVANISRVRAKFAF
jgi:hypothetical protein